MLRRVRVVCAGLAILLAAGSREARAQDELFVTNQNSNSVTIFTRTAGGNVAPLRTIQGAATGLNFPQGIGVDTVNNELFVVNTSTPSVTVYALTASGNVSPLRTISGGATGLGFPFGIAVDTVNNELFVSNGNFLSSTVTVYSRTATGNMAPLRTISGGATGLNFPYGLALDTVNNELFVANYAGAGPGASVTVYTRTTNGNLPALRTIQGAATGLNGPSGIALDTANNELAVGNNAADSVTVYARTASGNAPPLRTIQGAGTGLAGPVGVAVDAINGELAAANNNNNSVTVYARTASGNIAPLRTLIGAATTLNTPRFPAINAAAGAQAGIPTLDARGLVALTLLLAVVGLFAVRRMVS